MRDPQNDHSDSSKKTGNVTVDASTGKNATNPLSLQMEILLSFLPKERT